MKNRWAFVAWLVLILLFVPVLMGARCSNDTATTEASAEEQVRQVPVPPGTELNSFFYEPGTTDKSSAAFFICKEPMDTVAGFYDQQLAGKEDLEKVGKYSPAYIYTNEEGKVVVVRCETQETGSGYTNIYISVYDKGEYDALVAQAEADVVPVYPGAMVDSSEEAAMKAGSVGGEIYVTTDPIDKVQAFYESELAGMKDFVKQSSHLYTYTDEAGRTVQVYVMQTGPEGVYTNILISKE